MSGGWAEKRGCGGVCVRSIFLPRPFLLLFWGNAKKVNKILLNL